MRKIKATIQFTSPCLANMPIGGGEPTADKFDRDCEDRIIIRPNCLESAVHKTLKFSEFEHIRASDVIIAPEIDTTTRLWKRNYTSHGARKSRTHEMIPQDQRCTLELAVATHVNAAQAREFLVALGKFVGISPFGHNMGFGRFTLINVVDETEPVQGVEK